jgi:hypothetical protein
MSVSSAAVAPSRPRAEVLDFDLHGLVAIRLVGATPGDAEAVARQLGPLQAVVDREPDLVIRFVEGLERSARVRHIGLDDAGFTDDAFLLLRSKHKSPARVKIDFSELGGPAEIVCERGLAAVPLLIPILNMTLLGKGVLPLHASAFVHEGIGVVATGWSKGGKTEALLAFASHGAEYVGDEWVYIPGDGGRVFGIPEPIRMWRWQLQQLPQYERLIGRGERARLRALDALQGGASAWRRGPAGRARALLKRQLYVDVDPQRLFGRLGSMAAPFDRLFLLVGHEQQDVTVERIDPSEVARRMVFSLQHENLELTAAYLKYRFAFPESSSDLLERAASLQRDALLQVLADKPAFVVHHPYPVSLDGLFGAMHGYCR